MSETLQQMIERKNNQTAAARRKLFGKKATCEQVHENLCKAVELNIEAIHIFKCDPSNINGLNVGAALKELRAALSLSRRSLQS